MRTAWRWFVVAGCMLFLGGIAAAGNPLARPAKREAREHLDRGNRLYNTRSFDEAIVEFKAGALIEPASVFDYNLAQAYRQLGKYKEAIWHYERFLNYGHPAGELLDAVHSFLDEMRAQLANRALTMLPAEPVPPRADRAAQAAATPPPPSTEPRRSRASSEDSSRSAAGTDCFTWSMVGSGMAAMAGAGALFLSSSHLSDEANMEPDTRRRNQLHDQARTRSTIGVVVGVGGVGLATAGVIKLLLHAREAPPRAAVLDIAVTTNGAFVVGHF